MKIYFKIVPFLILTACTNVNKDDPGAEAKAGTTTNSKIKNGIIIEEHGLKVEQAFLLYEDKSLVPESNETSINKKIKCRLIFSGGWKEKDGKVFPGASETIETNTDKVVVSEKDLFSAYSEEGIDAGDAKYITLSAVITSEDKLFDYFVVKFKVWDKLNENYVSGSFKFKIK
jgi:hypothetical protein